MSGAAVVTGGSRGIGAATARVLAARGYGVCVAYRAAREAAEDVVREVRARGGRAVAAQADVARPEDAERLMQVARRELGPITTLVNSAGIAGRRASLAELTTAEILEVVQVNLMGTLYCTQAAAAHMARSRGGQGGAVVNVSSDAARTGGNRLAPYVAAKAGVSALTVALARELAGEGIRVNAVSPGIVRTDQYAHESPARLAELAAGIPLQRLGTPNEVAQAIAWLLSGEASYVTGAVVPVHGGR